MKQVIILLALLSLAGCLRESKSREYDGAFKIEFLFEKDGCKMYRFYDGRMVYWCNCEGKINADYTDHNGKTSNTVRRETIISK